MIFPICIRNPTINSQQTRRSLSPSLIHPSLNSHASSSHIQTTQHDIPTIQSMPILNLSSRSTNTYMNRRTTSRIPLYHYWTTSICLIFLHYPSPHTNHQHNRKQPPKMKISLCSILNTLVL